MDSWSRSDVLRRVDEASTIREYTTVAKSVVIPFYNIANRSANGFAVGIVVDVEVPHQNPKCGGRSVVPATNSRIHFASENYEHLEHCCVNRVVTVIYVTSLVLVVTAECFAIGSKLPSSGIHHWNAIS